MIATEIRAWVGARTVHGAMDVMVVHPRVVGALALVTAHEPPRANPFVRLFAGERGEGGGERERERERERDERGRGRGREVGRADISTEVQSSRKTQARLRTVTHRKTHTRTHTQGSNTQKDTHIKKHPGTSRPR